MSNEGTIGSLKRGQSFTYAGVKFSVQSEECYEVVPLQIYDLIACKIGDTGSGAYLPSTAWVTIDE